MPSEKMPADEPTDTEQQGGSEDCRDRDGPAEGPPRGWQEGLGGRTPKLLSEGAAAIHQRLLGSQQELEPRVAQYSDLSSNAGCTSVYVCICAHVTECV